ncbi:PAS domain S-box [Cylindrospermum stagnale PCC 7417]|uniref:Circadian input-output histidine kinase CikA n=1 Tax=Cylindrospermum stagnale PCC 7417 TaxID=56107 RepID=K9WVN7_9NOST|nr:PAS domain S-box protein [Cylindrospermum stagnale]AFZ24273.1 PAS domain S-box [Cylindrospermum stagnale PCC 7417]
MNSDVKADITDNFFTGDHEISMPMPEEEAADTSLDHILSTINEQFLALDRKWRYTYVNDVVVKVVGIPQQDLLGKCIWELFPDLVESQFYAEVHRAVTEQKSIQFQQFYDSNQRWFENRIYPSAHGVSVFLADITERKQNEERLARQAASAALRESEARFRLLAENSSDIISLHTVDGILLYISPACYTILGYEPEEIVGSASSELVHPDDLANFAISYPVNADLPNTYTITHRARHKNGQYIWMEATVRAIRDSQTQEILEIQSSSRDITERQRNQERQSFLAEASDILASSLEYEITLNSVARLAVRAIADWCVVDIVADNQSTCRVAVAHADSSKQELVEHLRNFPLNLAQSGGIAEVISTGKSQLAAVVSANQMQSSAIDIEYLKLLQQLTPKSGMCVPLIARGQVLGTITLVSSDDHRSYDSNDLMLAEELARRAAIAVDNARLYQEAQYSQQVAVQAASRTARLQAVTAALSESLTPTQVAEVIAQQGMESLGAKSALVALLTENSTELEIVRAIGYKQELVDAWRRFSINASVPLAEAVRTGQPIWQEPEITRVARYPHLAKFYAQHNYNHWISIPLMVKGRAVGGMSLSFTENQEFNQNDRALVLALAQQCAQAIERARLYEAEQIARETAEATNRIKDEFLAVLSHELRSPLNPILGWATLLRKQKLDAKTTDRALETIERNAQVQTQLIEDLLDVSRILQGKLSLNIYPVNLTSTIQAALETVRLSAEAKSIKIHTTFEPNLGKVLGDSSRLQQIFWNLLSNAVKFTPGGGRVDICLERIDSFAQIVVKDTGRGINPEFLPYVFDCFRQENSTTTRKFGGLGLGLAIVRQLIELHGGTVEAKSEGEDQGATFVVRLPLMPMQPQPPRESTKSESSPDLNGVKVLVVDDDTDTREFIVFLLEQEQANVIAVPNAREALAALTQYLPDILLSDIGMPDFDGYMLISQVRKLTPGEGGQIPAIALTAYAGEIDRERAFEAGFQGHVSKPVDPDNLVKAIANLLQQTKPPL